MFSFSLSMFWSVSLSNDYTYRTIHSQRAHPLVGTMLSPSGAAHMESCAIVIPASIPIINVLISWLNAVDLMFWCGLWDTVMQRIIQIQNLCVMPWISNAGGIVWAGGHCVYMAGGRDILFNVSEGIHLQCGVGYSVMRRDKLEVLRSAVKYADDPTKTSGQLLLFGPRWHSVKHAT